MDDRFMPPPIKGYVFWSNFGDSDIFTGKVHTLDSLVEHVALRLTIPPSSVWVEPFQVDDAPIAWAAYVQDVYADTVKASHQEITARLEVIKMKLSEGARCEVSE